jgi:CheY-like chemotaxis protein
MAGDDQGILEAGLDHYLTKPLHKNLIQQMILDHSPEDAASVTPKPD